MNWKLRLFELVLILAAAGIFVFLGTKEFAPSGILIMEKQVDEVSPFLGRVLPDSRTGEVSVVDGVSLQPIVAEPVYFTLTPSRDFNTLDVEVVFKNETSPIVELGILVNEENEQYRLKPLQNKLLDGLDWPTKSQNGVILYDRNGTYDSLADFLVDPPPLGEVAAYHYPFKRDFVIPGYRASNVVRTINTSIRGEHEMLTYIDGEDLNFTFEFHDMNRTIGSDPIEILVFDNNSELVAAKKVEDDGNASDNGRGSERQSVEINADLESGVYKIILKMSRDVFVRTIATTQQKLVFLNQVFAGDEVGYQASPRTVRFFTDTKNMTLETQHAEGVQDVVVDDTTVSVAEPFVPVSHRIWHDGIVSVGIPVGDVLIRGAGHYAFTRGMYFNPDPVRLEWDSHLDDLGVNYVIATYTPPEDRDGLFVGSVTFETAGIPKIRDAWKFALSIPGIYELGSMVELNGVTVTLHRPPMTFGDIWRKIWD